YNQSINILTINDDGLMLAVEIMQNEGKNYIVRYDDKLPRLFCDFPLLGTNDFTFPVVINSRNFDPNEPRNGIILYGEESEQNKSILKKACSLYVSLIDYFLQNNYKDIYNTVRLSHVENKDWIDKIWYEKEIISLLKRQISEFQMFTMADGSKQSLCDESGFSKNIFLSGDNTKEIRESVWQLSSQLFPDKLVCYEDIDNWYNSLWNECRNYSIIQLIEETEKIGNLHKLENKISDAIEWLNRLYNLIYEQCSKNPSVSRRDNKIFPNQHGEFCYIYDLKADIGIDEAYKEASDIIGIDLRKELADKHISFKNMNIISFNDIACRMWQRIQINNISYYIEIFYKRIISMKKNYLLKQEAFIKLYNILYSDNPIITVNVNHYSELLLNSAIEYWCEKICKDIAGCNLLSAFCSTYKFSTQDNAETWLSGFVRYLKAINKTDLLDKYSVIPNQNGGFRLKPNLYIDSDTVPDFMKDVCRVAGTDFREEMVSSKTDVSQIIPRKKGYKEVSDVITNYMRSHMNNINVNAVEKEAFNKTYLWLRENKDNPDVKQHFSELIEHLYWFYNDEEISESISKAKEFDNILNKFGISDVRQLEKILTCTELSKPAPITDAFLCQYGISSEEELRRLIDSKILDDNFIHEIEHSSEKFQYVQKILQRSLNNIQKY
ncbi:MAG: ATP-binding protein, partial [Ruminococcus sp.]|nr:ATP-binding protein [Ruminococcus sp.]